MPKRSVIGSRKDLRAGGPLDAGNVEEFKRRVALVEEDTMSGKVKVTGSMADGSQPTPRQQQNIEKMEAVLADTFNEFFESSRRDNVLTAIQVLAAILFGGIVLFDIRQFWVLLVVGVLHVYILVPTVFYRPTMRVPIRIASVILIAFCLCVIVTRMQ